MNRILITGANGMLGKALQKVFAGTNYEIIQHTRAHSDIATLDGLKEFDNLLSRCNPYYVVHTAAMVGGIEYNDHHPYTFNVANTVMNTGVLDACVTNNVPRFLGILSVCCYGEGFVESDFPLTEDKLFAKEPHPTNAGYAYSKRNFAQQILAANKQLKRRYNYMIPCNLYGPNDRRGYRAHFGSVMVDKVLRCLADHSQTITFQGDGRVKRQYLHIDDFAKLIKRHIDIDVDANYNVAPIEELSAEEMVLELLDELKYRFPEFKPTPVFNNTMVAGQMKRTVSTATLERLHPDFEFTKFRKGILEVFNSWYQG